jgi:inosose dehydratase
VRKIFGLTSIDFCPDTAHLAAAGGDPAAMIREHRTRISYVHLKGWQREPFAFTPLDRGDLDMSTVARALSDIAFDGWITVELDAWSDPQQGAVKSMAFLREAEARA